MLAKVKEQDGMTLAKVKEQDGMMLAEVKLARAVSHTCLSDTPSSEPHLTKMSHAQTPH